MIVIQNNKECWLMFQRRVGSSNKSIKKNINIIDNIYLLNIDFLLNNLYKYIISKIKIK